MNIEKNTQEAEYYFHQGTNFYSYDYLGASKTVVDKEYKYTFRVWAPNAYNVALVSDFSGWDTPIFMNKGKSGVWEVEYLSKEALEGNSYKFRIEGKNGVHYKGDPYARYSKGGADGASVIYESSYVHTDDLWQKNSKRRRSNERSYLSFPINIYELNLLSFLKTETDEYLSYRELAEILPFYLRYMGYTHVEFMPIMEYPYDGSWGYQVGAFFAPSSRLGTPDDFKFLIDSLHNAEIGVILDWVPAHFPKDEWGLFEFDGSLLYEYQGFDRCESLIWKTRFFDVGREEVQSFLISNALYLFREFHVDGLRVDAVAAMLYLDYDKPDGGWIKNTYGGKENLESIAFFKKLNTAIFSEFPNALMIAEESGDFGKITHPAHDGGLGFNLKWNMGWANDFFKYLSGDPIFRKYEHTALTFPIQYAYSENYVLPISHDEVVHGKKSLINKMFGSYEDKFKQTRLALMLMMTYPGKKLTFMGTEFGQFREWDYMHSLEWFMLDYEKHHDLREYVCALNRFYIKNEALWYYDFSHIGFEWLSVDENEKNSVCYKRHGKDTSLIILLNFSGSEQTITFEFDRNKSLFLKFSTDDLAENISYDKKYAEKYDISVKLSAFSGRIYEEKAMIIETV